MRKLTILHRCQYRFILNPFEDVRFSTCPECSQRTLLRKVPLAVHVDPHHSILLNKHCRYCPDCDLMIAHKDEIEHLLVITFEQRNSGVIGNDYLILGSVDKSTWRKQQKAPIPMGELIGYLHDFKEYLTLSYTLSGWYREDQPPVLRKTPPPKPTAFTNPKLEESPLTNIIDDPRQVETLIKKMELLLPISAEIRRGPASYLRSQGSFIPPHRNIEIQNVLNG